MIRTLSKQGREHVAAVVAQARRCRDRGPLPSRRAALLRAYCQDVAENDLLSADPSYLASALLSHLSLGRNRRPGTAKVRIFNPDRGRDGWHSDRTVIQIVNDNMPFLVDSVTMCLNEHGRGIQLMMHPLLRTTRSSNGRLTALAANRPGAKGHTESFIYMEIGKELDGSDLARLQAALEATLADVRSAVQDWQPMLAELRGASVRIRREAPHLPGLLEESCALIDWLADDHFTLLGYKRYRLHKGRSRDRLIQVAGSGLGLLRSDAEGADGVLELTGAGQREARAKNALVITKSRRRSTVHRSGYLDQIYVKEFGKSGMPIGVQRFLGLYTSMVYAENPVDIPLLRLKVEEVVRESGFDPRSHRGKALQHILSTFPRDDLFQISISDLARISFGVLNLQERQQVRLFWRRDALSRYYSCFVYLPRDHYTAHARRRVERILLEAFNGTRIETRLSISESVLARLEATIRAAPDAEPPARLSDIEARLRSAVESWDDRLRTVLLEDLEETEALGLYHRFASCFPLSYQEAVSPARAAEDIRSVAAIVDGESAIEMSLQNEPDERAPARFVLRTCRLVEAIPLYTAVPILERMGMQVLSERIYRIDAASKVAWLQEFDLAPAVHQDTESEHLERRFLDCFLATLEGHCENDEFNAFVMLSGLDWREASLLRAYCRYLLQTGLPFSQAYMQQVLARYPDFSRSIVAGFHAAFDPELSSRSRRSRTAASKAAIESALDRVTNLDEDRIMRAFLGMLTATLRTNYFQRFDGAPREYLSLKLDPKQLPELPRPKPMFEIFVFSPRVEGVHLRSSPVARGGLRWSDRREDFRTEILGLMKAQQVKNTIIVPTGAKGGFVCKKLPDGDREAVQAEVVSCYKTFVRALLDVTDNIVDDRVVTPERVLRRDGDDPYLVVAADKGTATFSDTANAISAEYEFWLGDAFASGGSAGYDHKQMAITARGAWESVKRHFREIGIDPLTQSFTAIGIGDMSGDVFGNGMLLSKHMKLVAAFNHKHIFIDPDPDPQASFAERRRLFALPRSGWDDYSPDQLSTGGGVYSRQAKSIALHPAAQRALGIEQDKLTPPELIRAILRAPVDLFWNGGIGTYIKSRLESQASAGDPMNDAVRVNADELRCKVIAEGGNLGLTQLGRVEFALRGGMVNADFIDNSGGVDSSDREVNIKILLDRVIRDRKLTRARRNTLLSQMADDVADLVLQDNYAQTQALSVMSAHSFERLGENARLIKTLEAQGHLDRHLEFLPSEDAIAERAAIGKGLTRPELAVIFSYAKILLTGQLVASNVPEDPYFDSDLIDYFPPRLGKRFGTAMRAHRLHREITAMRVANEVINRMGPAFPFRAVEDTAASTAKTIRAYAIARDAFDVQSIWAAVEAADNTVPPALQYEILFHVGRMLRRATYWLLQRHPHNLVVSRLVAKMRPMIATVSEQLLELESPSGRQQIQKDIEELTQIGVSPILAHRVAALGLMPQTLDIIDVTERYGLDVTATAQLYFELEQGLELNWIRQEIEDLSVDGRWQAVARDTLRQNLAREHSAVLGRILATRGTRTPHDALVAWLEQHALAVKRVHQIVQDMRAQEGADFATLSVAIREIERLG